MATKIGEELKSVFLKVSSAFTVDGVIAKAGDIVEVLEDDAISLLNRGKAELATIEHAIAAGLLGDDAQAGDDDTGDAGAQAAAADPVSETVPAPAQAPTPTPDAAAALVAEPASTDAAAPAGEAALATTDDQPAQ